MKQPLKKLDKITDAVLAYRPKKKKAKVHKKAVRRKTTKTKKP